MINFWKSRIALLKFRQIFVEYNFFSNFKYI